MRCRLRPSPIIAICRGPDVGIPRRVDTSRRAGVLIEGLPPDDPHSPVVGEDLVQRPAGHQRWRAGVDQRPFLAIGRRPDVGLVVAELGVAPDDPKLVIEDQPTRRVARLPRRVRKLDPRPPVVTRAPDLVGCGRAVPCHGIPAADQKQAAVQRKQTGTVSARRGTVFGYQPPIALDVIGTRREE